jgi:hypothetical protein
LTRKKDKPLEGADGSQAALPGRILILGGMAFALIVVLSFSLGPSIKKYLTGELKQQKAPTSRLFSSPSSDSATGFDDHHGGQLIRSIHLIPLQPTRLNTLRAEVIPAVSDAGRLTYSYIWKVNDRTILDVSGDSLDLANFKRRDLIYVSVTPYDGNRAGFTVKSPVVAVYGVTPSLELNAIGRRKLKAGEPLVLLQLSSIHPETEEVTFSLESPSIPGMTIDGKTGKITWIVQPGQEGTLPFGASVSDIDGTKVTRVFEVNVGKPPSSTTEN